MPTLISWSLREVANSPISLYPPQVSCSRWGPELVACLDRYPTSVFPTLVSAGGHTLRKPHIEFSVVQNGLVQCRTPPEFLQCSRYWAGHWPYQKHVLSLPPLRKEIANPPTSWPCSRHGDDKHNGYFSCVSISADKLSSSSSALWDLPWAV